MKRRHFLACLGAVAAAPALALAPRQPAPTFHHAAFSFTMSPFDEMHFREMYLKPAAEEFARRHEEALARHFAQFGLTP